MYRLEPAEQLEDLRSISENVEDYCARELFKDTYGAYGDYDVADILRECYSLVLEELTDFGVFFSTDVDDLLADWPTAKQIYYTKWLVDTAQLYELLKDKATCDHVESIISSDESIDTELFSAVWTVLAEHYPTVFNLQQIQDRVDEIYANADFRTHVRNIIKMIRDTDGTSTLDQVSRAKAYIEKEIHLRDFVYAEVERLAEQLVPRPNLNLRLLRHLKETYDQDKLTAESLKTYSLIDMGEVHPSLEGFRSRMMEKHHRTSSHHIEYWEGRQEMPTLEHLLYLVANCQEPEDDEHQYRTKVIRLLNTASGCFTPEVMQQLRDITACFGFAAGESLESYYGSMLAEMVS